MRSPVNFLPLAMLFALALGWVSQADAHDYLKEPLMERYNLKSVACSACHPGSNKAINNYFGLQFKKAFKGKNYTADVKKYKEMKKDAAKKAEAEEKLEAIGKDMVAEFNRVVVEVEKTQVTMADMIKAGLLNGTKLQKETIAAMGKAQGVTEEK